MSLDTDALLARFHRVLVEEISAKRPSYLTSPFSVAEIYQDLVPYGTHRDRIGVEMNGDYEDLLLRLLAGEGGYLHLESDTARARLAAELRSTHTDTGLYREYAAADVRLDPGRVPPEAHERGEQAEDAEDDSVPVESLAPSGPSGPSVRTGQATAHAGPGRDDPPKIGIVREESDAPERALSTTDGEGRPTTCRWCRESLPHREKLHYCPFCGTDVHVVPCPSCGEALEPAWRFCIACGADVVTE